jgi:putative ABC transport system permease protein
MPDFQFSRFPILMPVHLRFAVRQLAKSPAFTAIAVLTLALGIGSAAVVFTALNALLLRPLPLIQDQDRMLWLNQSLPAKDVETTQIALADFLAWRSRSQTLSALWIYENRTAIITGRSEPRRQLGVGISAGAFQAMGVQPIRGRNFLPEEDEFGGPPAAILSHELWKNEFGGADDVLGQSIKLNGVDTTIVGVMPAGWRYPERADLWMPLQPNPAELHRGHPRYAGHAMLKPGVTLDEARAEFATISAALAKEYPMTNEGLVAVLRPVREQAAEGTATLTLLLFGAVIFVFLIACANVANLLLARASVRTKEIAIRLALGASRRQIVGQLLVEAVLLSLLGGIGGLVFALWGVDLMLSAIPIELPFWMRFELDPRVVAFVTGLSLLASMIFGLVPAWQASRPDLVEEIKEGGRGAAGGARSHEVRHTLVIVEIALALVLLVGAGLMMRSFLTLQHTPPGFDPRGVLTFRVGFPPAMTDDKVVFRRFFAELMPRLGALPGVEAATAVSALPGVGSGGFSGIVIEGEPEPSSMATANAVVHRVITPRYFDTLRIPLKAGRVFNAHDDETHPHVAVVDEQFVRKHFPQHAAQPQAVIGKRFHSIGKSDDTLDWVEIVGVVGVTRRFFDRDETAGCLYVPHAQSPANFMSVALRVTGDPASYLTAVRSEVLALNKDMPIYAEMPLQTAINRSDSVWRRSFFGTLFGAFAIVALLLATIGIYGVMAYSVAQRTQEIGVRMALGAQPGDVIRMVVRQGVRLVGTGLVLGFIAAFFMAQLLAGNLYGISPRDPPTFAAVPLLLAAVALLACYIPSRRATHIDPIAALRAE